MGEGRKDMIIGGLWIGLGLTLGGYGMTESFNTLLAAWLA